MGCGIMAALDTDAAKVPDLLAKVAGWFEKWEQALSRFREDSELSQLNRRAGEAVVVGPVLWEVARRSLQAARQSDGLVTPTLLNALVAAGYDRTFDQIRLGPQPAPVAAAEPQAPADWRSIRMDAQARTITVPAGLRLDFGGIAKGWAAERAAKQLGAVGPALVNAGGDVAVFNSRRLEGGRRGWTVGVDDPLNAGGHIALIVLPAGGVATSGRDYRRWQQGDLQQHHILDPRTGRPAQTDVLAATVVALSAADAEVAAKAALILGSRDGLKWINARPDLAGLLVLEDGAMLHSARIKQYLWS